MRRLQTLAKAFALPLAFILALTSLPLGTARAALVTTDQVLAQHEVATDRARVEAFVEREDVRAQMIAFGVDPREAAKRVAALSDEEIRAIAGHLDELPAGQSAVGALIGAAVFIFLVLLITDLLGLTNIFPFVRR